MPCFSHHHCRFFVYTNIYHLNGNCVRYSYRVSVQRWLLSAHTNTSAVTWSRHSKVRSNSHNNKQSEENGGYQASSIGTVSQPISPKTMTCEVHCDWESMRSNIVDAFKRMCVNTGAYLVQAYTHTDTLEHGHSRGPSLRLQAASTTTAK